MVTKKIYDNGILSVIVSFGFYISYISTMPIAHSSAQFFFESKHFIYIVRNFHSRETEQHFLNIVT